MNYSCVDISKNNNEGTISNYPYGMQATTFTRTAADPTQYLYNGGVEQNDYTSYYETFFRNYDASIGRFTGIDIMAGKYSSLSPYNYAANDPVYYNDPMGDDLSMADELRMGMGGNCHTCDAAGGGGGYGSYYGYGGSVRNQLSAMNNTMPFDQYVNGSVQVSRDMDFVQSAFKTAGITFGDDGTFLRAKKSGIWAENGMSIIEWEYGAIDLEGLLSSSNPLIRAYGMALRDGNLNLLRNFQNKSIHFSYGDYLTEHLREDNLGRQVAKFAGVVMTAPLAAMVAVPMTLSAAAPSLTGFGAGTASSRAVSGTIDLVTQLSVNLATNGGNFGAALTDINLTSIGLSALNPTGSIQNVALNSTLSSTFELKLNGSSQNILTGKSPADIAKSVTVSLAANGLFTGLASVARYGIGNTQSMATSMINAGISPGSKAYMWNAYIGTASQIMSTTGFVSASVGISTNIVD